MLALAASVAATGAVAVGLAYTEGAFVDNEDDSAAAIVTPSSSTDGVYMGTAEYTEWGDVQVEVAMSGGEIVDVVAVQIPAGRKSSSINDRAEPMLEAQAIEIQAADLDIVSGATYTSITYADSLQAALDQAALAESRSIGGATS